MFDDMKTKGALKKINEGGTAELSKSQIVLSLVNLNAVFKPMKRDDFKKMPKDDKKKVNAILDWYKELRSEKTKEVYDKEKLDEVSAQILAELKELQGPTEEEIVENVKEFDEDVKAAEDIDMDDFFGSGSSSAADDEEDEEEPEAEEDEPEEGESDDEGAEPEEDAEKPEDEAE